MYAVDGAALLDARADTKQPDGPRYPATDASSGWIYVRDVELDEYSEIVLLRKHGRVHRLAHVSGILESVDSSRLSRNLMNGYKTGSRIWQSLNRQFEIKTREAA